MSTPQDGRRRRRLRPDEIDLWLKVAATIENRRPGALLPEPPKPVDPTPAAPEPPVDAPASALQPKPKPVAPRLAPIERGVRRKLLRGRIDADAVLDLHGYRQAEAHVALRNFLYQSQARGARLVLVVTGKGGRSRDEDLGVAPWGQAGVGVLKRVVPLWLAQPDFRDLVVGFEDAGPVHGGSGALYVRLRRHR